MTGEVFYLHIQGEQRGPYTVKQIDHQLNSGIISEDTLYWREGMEEWLPVTKLVALRKPTKIWKIRRSAVIVFLVLLVLGRFFGPTVVEGWREMAQYEFTERAAYWKAREAVRRGFLPSGSVVRFGRFASAESVLHEGPPRGATVLLRGEVTGSDGKTVSNTWQVVLAYQPLAKQWMAQKIEPR